MWRDNWSRLSALILLVLTSRPIQASADSYLMALQSASALSFSLQTEQQPQKANVAARSERGKALRAGTGNGGSAGSGTLTEFGYEPQPFGAFSSAACRALAASVFSDKVGLYTLATAYRNTPTLLRRSKSPISHGGLLVSVRGNPVHQLDGEYWTDRYTMGEVKFTAKIRPQCHEFDEARKHKYDVIAN